MRPQPDSPSNFRLDGRGEFADRPDLVRAFCTPIIQTNRSCHGIFDILRSIMTTSDYFSPSGRRESQVGTGLCAWKTPTPCRRPGALGRRRLSRPGHGLHSRPDLRLSLLQRHDASRFALSSDAESPISICVNGGLYKLPILPLNIHLKPTTRAQSLNRSIRPGFRKCRQQLASF